MRTIITRTGLKIGAVTVKPVGIVVIAIVIIAIIGLAKLLGY